ncbi:MAG TPA: hypothetical protein VF796_22485, partial [Humisphaera sp.]
MSQSPLAPKPKSAPQPPAKPASAAQPSTAVPPADAPARARAEHGYMLMAGAYRTQIQAVVGDDPKVLESARLYAFDLIGRLAPRDPLEEMLVAQLLQTHARVTYLNVYAAQQSSLKWSAQFHEAADRASNTFRRQMQALAEYRNPKPPPRSVTRIAQANIANQQVVHNAAGPSAGAGNATNEQGSPDARTGRPETAPPPALPAVPGRAGGPAGD